MQRQQGGSGVRDGADSARYRIWNVVQFKVEEDFIALVSEPPDQVPTGRVEELHTDLKPLAAASKLLDELEGATGGRHIQRHNQSVVSLRHIPPPSPMLPAHARAVPCPSMPQLLTIAGFDPSSGAGITADLATFAAHGLFGTACITALTVQSTLGVQSVHAVDAGEITGTLMCLEADLPPDGIKIGMLANAASVQAVAEYLELLRRRGRRPLIVLDPVSRSSSGRELLDTAGQRLLQDRLLDLVDWITPNTAELALLCGQPVGLRAELPQQAGALQQRYPKLNLVVTGGHLEPPDDLVLPAGSPARWVPGRRIMTTATHGTGCAFSSALLCHLALGAGPYEAARSAKQYVVRAMETATKLGHGKGPMNHLWTRPVQTEARRRTLN